LLGDHTTPASTTIGDTVPLSPLKLDTAIGGLTKGTVLTVGSSAAGVTDR
jgi:hypothetical protein